MQTSTASNPAKVTVQRDIVLTDIQIVSQDLLRDLKRVRASYFRLRAEMERHKNITRPAYFAWYEDRFGAQSARVNSLKMKFEDKLRLVQRMNALYAYRGMTRHQALKQASRDHEAMKARRRLEEAQAREEAAKGERTSASQAESKSPPSPDAELKCLYRKLARALHPDRSGSADCPVLKAFWQDTQDAYQARDLERLKSIWTECLLEAESDLGDVPLPDLKLATSRLKTRFHRLQKEKIASVADDPAWRFGRRDFAALEESIAARLDQEEAELRDDLSGLDREIQAFAR